MRATWKVFKNIIGNFFYLYLTILYVLFILPVHYGFWKRKHPGKGIEQYLGENDMLFKEREE